MIIEAFLHVVENAFIITIFFILAADNASATTKIRLGEKYPYPRKKNSTENAIKADAAIFTTMFSEELYSLTELIIFRKYNRDIVKPRKPNSVTTFEDRKPPSVRLYSPRLNSV